MYFVQHHTKKHITSGCSTISEAELDYLVKVVTDRTLLCKDIFFPLLLGRRFRGESSGMGTFW